MSNWRRVVAKALVISTLCLLTLYAPIELSRLIIIYGFDIGTVFEMCFIWAFYLLAVGILTKVVKV